MELDENELDNVIGGLHGSNQVDDLLITNTINYLKKDGKAVTTESVIREIAKVYPVVSSDLIQQVSDIITINKR